MDYLDFYFFLLMKLQFYLYPLLIAYLSVNVELSQLY